MIRIVREGSATCVYEPRGDKGLEGFQLRDFYRFQEMVDCKGTYYRVYPHCEFGPGNYYETCSKQSFNKYFTEV